MASKVRTRTPDSDGSQPIVAQIESPLFSTPPTQPAAPAPTLGARTRRRARLQWETARAQAHLSEILATIDGAAMCQPDAAPASDARSGPMTPTSCSSQTGPTPGLATRPESLVATTPLAELMHALTRLAAPHDIRITAELFHGTYSPLVKLRAAHSIRTDTDAFVRHVPLYTLAVRAPQTLAAEFLLLARIAFFNDGSTS